MALACLPAAQVAEARPKCAGKKADIVRGDGDDVIRAHHHGPQVIVAGAGNDVIVAKRNKDIVCAGEGDDRIMSGPGQDRVFAGAGNDTIDGGPGSDRILAGDGSDVVLGGAGGEDAFGGPGDDRLFGEIQDDRLSGDAGNDLLAGGHGVDDLGGGPDHDWIRGDLNRDRFAGDDGVDTLSFATATPPGPSTTMGGVAVDLRIGYSSGDEATESGAGGIENVVGSPFDDAIAGWGKGFVRGNGGRDLCIGFASVACGQIANGVTPIAYLVDTATPDPGLVVLGSAASETWTVSKSGPTLRVSGSPIIPGPGCTPGVSGGTSTTLTCSDPSTVLGYVILYGGAGNDTLTVDGGFDRTTLIKGDGGAGDDTINGGPASDLLAGGEYGADRLFGNDGNDAIIGRGGGGDLLDGGPGTDQLVSNNPCDGHTYDGGGGRADVAGFGHVTIGGVKAKLGGVATMRDDRDCSATRLLKSAEILEGSSGNDMLIGDGAPNLIIARRGDDVLFGRGGRDELRGDEGKDRCHAGSGGAVKLSC